MENEIEITKELLFYLKKDGYNALIRRFGSNTFLPAKEEANKLIASMSIIPLKEDELILIEDAISYFEELNLCNRKMVNIFEL